MGGRGRGTSDLHWLVTVCGGSVMRVMAALGRRHGLWEVLLVNTIGLCLLGLSDLGLGSLQVGWLEGQLRVLGEVWAQGAEQGALVGLFVGGLLVGWGLLRWVRFRALGAVSQPLQRSGSMRSGVSV